jgi:rRNA maturation endonuclease Nob1
MMAKGSERQFQLNAQFNEDLATIKTQLLFTTQALAAAVTAIEALTDRLVQRRVIAEDDELMSDFRKAIEVVRKLGLRLEPPEDPDKPIFQVRCPGCNAVLKAQPGQQVERCDWCGHVFSG